MKECGKLRDDFATWCQTTKHEYCLLWKAISAHAIAVKGTQLTLGQNCGLEDVFMVNNYPCSYFSE